MNVQSSSDNNSKAPTRPSRRAVLGLAFGLALSGVGATTSRVVAKPQPKRPAKPGGRRTARRRRQRRPRIRVVTRTFSSTTPITIPDAAGAASPYPATIQVGGLRAGTILDLNATLSGLSHTRPHELEVVLVAPNGQTAVVLMSDVGDEYEVATVTLVFDDQAASFLPFDAQIVSGSFKPTAPGAAPRAETATLRAFTGLNPNGTWRLYVADSLAGDDGSIGGWALTIKARVRV